MKLKVSREDKFIGICFIVIAAIIGGSILYNNYTSKRDIDELTALNDKLIQEKFKVLANEKKRYQDIVKLSNHKADSALNIIVVIQGQLKQNQIYYAKKIKALSAVNTYDSRQRYSDSLSGTIH